MPITKTTASMDAFKYECLWKTVTLGYCKDVDPGNVQLNWLPLTTGETGSTVLDRFFEGLDPNSSVSIVMHQVKVETLQTLCPWWTSGSVIMTPAMWYSQRANAGLLRLHPIGVSGTAQDLVFPLAYPTFRLPRGNPQGQSTFREIPTTWFMYSDATALPAIAGTHALGNFPDPE